MTYTEEVVRRSGASYWASVAATAFPAASAHFLFGLLATSRFLCLCPHSVGNAVGLFGWGWAGGGSKAVASASAAPFPAPEREAAEAQPWPPEPEE